MRAALANSSLIKTDPQLPIAAARWTQPAGQEPSNPSPQPTHSTDPSAAQACTLSEASTCGQGSCLTSAGMASEQSLRHMHGAPTREADTHTHARTRTLARASASLRSTSARRPRLPAARRRLRSSRLSSASATGTAPRFRLLRRPPLPPSSLAGSNASAAVRMLAADAMTGAASSMSTAATSDRTASSSTTGLGALDTSAENSALASLRTWQTWQQRARACAQQAIVSLGTSAGNSVETSWRTWLDNRAEYVQSNATEAAQALVRKLERQK
eukprot:353517-Chlamydomonas_euryale.AAC.11